MTVSMSIGSDGNVRKKHAEISLCTNNDQGSINILVNGIQIAWLDKDDGKLHLSKSVKLEVELIECGFSTVNQQIEVHDE
jgi:hypothetical protein